jgi:hypothetical protein
MQELIKRIIPVFLIIFIGYLLRRKNIISDGGVSTLKTLIVTLFLPASLFYSFLYAELTSKYFYLIAVVLVICFLLYLIGLIFKKAGILDSIYSAEFFTGFEFGMVGIALFSAIFGMDSLSIIATIGLGHEFFIWFIYLPLLKSHAPGSKDKIGDILISFAKSPIILAILSAIILNKTGIAAAAHNNFITGGILTTLNWFSSVTVSVVLIVLGCSLRFEHLELRKSLKYTLLRFIFVMLISIPSYFALNILIPGLPPLFLYAWLTFFLLPPPYIIPIYVPAEHAEENSFLSNTIVLYTLISLAVYVIYLFINPPLL